ncbi:tetraspanin-11 isoform X2 [Stegostoma tigrinum]|uniref:tetraspanin-11 isoform X2 n=1 Tax=Stegostoma tigrinum TaxID=3053191 RepID=UPI00202B96B1|nr:tetraspanin-11 isoform X2 [Stegostoma tigrinum]
MMTEKCKEGSEDCLTICLKYLLFFYNFLFWMAGAGVMTIGTWTLAEKRNYLSLLPSSTFAVSASILIFAGGLVLVTGFFGCRAVVREQQAGLAAYFSLLLLIFLTELVAGILACVYYQQLSDELKQSLHKTMMENYAQPGEEAVTYSIDQLQQDFKCCGSNSSANWQHSAYILSPASGNRLVPDSCCKTITEACGQRDHPSNIYKVEGFAQSGRRFYLMGVAVQRFNLDFLVN